MKAYVLEHSGLKVSSLYISQVKRKLGLDVGVNYNKAKNKDSRVPNCPKDKEDAIVETFKSVMGSSFTTIAGFLVLCTMQLTLGKDLGIVMAKGVLLGLLSVFTLFPSLLLAFDKLIDKTKHKRVKFNFEKLNKFIVKNRVATLIIFIILLIPAYLGYKNIDVYYKIDRSLPDTLESIEANSDLKDKFNIVSPEILLISKDIKTNDAVNMINEIIPEIHDKLTFGKEKILLCYDKNVDCDIYYDELLKIRDKDIKYQTTQIGPHRDDIIFTVNGMDVKKYGSQGQQRTVALSLKLAEIELVKKLINDNPILLLDDVMSELDSNRRDALLESIDDIQTIITCTGYDDFIKERLNIDKIYKVTQGKVE